jgi:two-component system cell cycle sensor histidine kinase/response regulator CckA
MPAGGELTIETTSVWLDEATTSEHFDAPTGWYAFVSVTDNGAGMDEETVSHAFEPFFTTKAEGAGTGLGLATVYGIVRQSGGHIRVSSKLGGGTTVSLYFPVGEDGAATGMAGSPPAAARSAQAILIVDDDASILSLLEQILSRHGYETLVAPDAVAALDVAARTSAPIALLLTDISLPGMTGAQLATALHESNPSLRIVYTSGFSVIPRDDSGSLPPHGLLLRKPFTASQLLGAVRAALEDGDEE